MFRFYIKTLVIFFAIDRVFQVVDINIDMKNDKSDEIRKEDIPEGGPKGKF